ncbi:hypothetical protein Aeqsu_0190 [Aequorivita sublithincola DSM 14238]|uniref:Uncharacterized protein n=1 Tax=Aequorivita sublithincola (strain DSM 14238 / LMG 21431 / ACAM 643 / 9-3) TaxID=746697 RepID=I3YRU7_AEQSU|nr:hypothetical protein [Aequorivita sublithincola]AFL79715.1 hypothetical protein Aeqsu_0190 [Aequorivita sublithincola DSM 14238]
MQLVLWKIACEDYQVLLRASKNSRRAFSYSGIVMCLNYLIALLGLYQFFEIIFINIFIALILGAFVTVVFMNIYKLCLTTLNKDEKSFSLSYILSLLGRLIFVGLIGLLAIKGLESFLVFTIFERLNLVDYEGKILLSLKDINNKIPWIWVSSILLLLVFISPFLVKFSIKPSSKYVLEKRAIEKKIILDDYKRFKEIYKNIFYRDYKLPIEYKENYLDPPFNNIPIVITKKLGNNEDFLNSLTTEEIS